MYFVGFLVLSWLSSQSTYFMLCPEFVLYVRGINTAFVMSGSSRGQATLYILILSLQDI